MWAIETPRCKLVVRATGTRLGKVPGSSLAFTKDEPKMVFIPICFWQMNTLATEHFYFQEDGYLMRRVLYGERKKLQRWKRHSRAICLERQRAIGDIYPLSSCSVPQPSSQYKSQKSLYEIHRQLGYTSSCRELLRYASPRLSSIQKPPPHYF